MSACARLDRHTRPSGARLQAARKPHFAAPLQGEWQGACAPSAARGAGPRVVVLIGSIMQPHTVWTSGRSFIEEWYTIAPAAGSAGAQQQAQQFTMNDQELSRVENLVYVALL